MASLIPYDPLVDTGIDELFRGFFQPIRMEGRAAPVTIKMDVTEETSLTPFTPKFQA